MIVIDILNVVSAVNAGAAAYYWWLSTTVVLPSDFQVHVVAPTTSMQQPMGGDPLGGKYVGQAHSADFATLAAGLQKQTSLSKSAALFASVAAGFQSLALLAGLT